jgi:hypothetical protein
MGYPNNQFMNGQIATKFEITTTDSIRGIRVMFAKANASFDDISFHIYQDNAGIPGVAVQHPALPLIARRLYSKNAASPPVETFVGTDQFILYEFSQPVRLEKGTY